MQSLKSLFGALVKKSFENRQSIGEEDTKSSENQSSPSPILYESEIQDSFLGSISEGTESMLAQKIPPSGFQLATVIPSTHSDVMSHALYKAAQQNKAELCGELLQKSFYGDAMANVNFKDENKNTPLHVGASQGYLKVCEALLDYGDSTNLDAKNIEERTPLHLACKFGHLQVVQLLVRSGADIDTPDEDGNTPLHLASENAKTDVVSWLLTKHPNLFIENKFEKTPAEVAGTEETKALFAKYSNRSQNSTFRGNSPRLCVREMSFFEEIKEPSRVFPLDFEILTELGKGSFGEVYLVRKSDSCQLYAMKVLRKEKIMGQNLIKYAMTERHVLSYINHPFIVSLNFAFQTPEKLFLILDYCPGGDLSSHLAREKHFDEYKARIYTCEILLALEELHRHGIIFRDLKPDNIVVDEDGHALLTDFGLSKEGVYDGDTAKSFCGSLAYLAPEMIRRQGHGKTVDWYLLGVLFYEMVVGIPPYFSNNKEELFNNIQKGKLKLPSSLSLEAKDLIIELLQRDPSKRLGAKRDAEEIKAHKFFQGIDWDKVMRKELKPPVPPKKCIPDQRIEPRLVYGDLSRCEEKYNRVSGWSFVLE
ncbi:unnamed protein product [Blepharisma stoltei]|uniref:Uncharacterized protein n=1 Tax=Blepharisma stoltei TaxID=1481888 RepID=A0AAU9J2Q5_9CILI|nr:unnamed protein product [Blepharisma stoltei]